MMQEAFDKEVDGAERIKELEKENRLLVEYIRAQAKLLVAYRPGGRRLPVGALDTIDRVKRKLGEDYFK